MAVVGKIGTVAISLILKVGSSIKSSIANFNGASLASIITTELQMWLGFEKTDVIGSELITNGSFSTGSLSPFVASTSGTGIITVVDTSLGDGDTIKYGVRIQNTAANTNNSNLRLDGVKVVGSIYELTYTITDNSSGSIYLFGDMSISAFDDSVGTHTVSFVGTNSRLTINRVPNEIVDITITDISLKEVSQLILDKSTNTNNAKLFTGKALSFDRVNDYVEFNPISLPSEFSIAIWMKQNVLSNKIIGDLASYSSIITVVGSGNKIDVKIGGVRYVFESSVVFKDIWSRLVITRDSSNLVSVYVNNKKSTTAATTITGELVISSLCRIGAFYGGGILSDFQIYNAAWDEDDVTYDYANPNNLVFNNEASSIILGNLIIYCALSEGSGSIVYDSSGRDNNGAINGATYDDKQPTIPQLGMMDWAKSTPSSTVVTLIEAPNDLGKDILGNALRLREGGFNLDGSGYGSIANSTTLTDITNGTIQFWLKTSDTKFSILNGQSSSEFIGKTDNGVWSFGNAGTITSYIGSDTASTQPLYNNAWNFYTFTGVNLSTWTSFLISNLTSFELDCIVDDLLIYSDVLTASEITNNYNVGLPTHTN